MLRKGAGNDSGTCEQNVVKLEGLQNRERQSAGIDVIFVWPMKSLLVFYPQLCVCSRNEHILRPGML